jgi:hypothetical protein
MAQEFLNVEMKPLGQKPRLASSISSGSPRKSSAIRSSCSLPYTGLALEPSLERIRLVQGLLGGINDCDTVRSLLSKYEDADKVTSWLKKRQRRRIEEFRRYWTETFAEGELRNWRALLSHPGMDVRATRKPAARAGVASHTAGRRPAAVA